MRWVGGMRSLMSQMLRQENTRMRQLRAGEEGPEVAELQAVVVRYQRQCREMEGRVEQLEAKLVEAQQEVTHFPDFLSNL